MFENNFLKIKIPNKSDIRTEILDINNSVGSMAVPVSAPAIPTKMVSKFAIVLTLIALLILLFRLAIIQVYTAPIWQDWASRSSNQVIYIIPPRGRILDASGKVIVDSQVSFSMVTNLKNLQDQDKRDLIKSRLNLSENDIDNLIKEGYAGFVKIKDGLSTDEMLSLADLSAKLEVELIPNYTRSYLDKNLPNQQYKIESMASIVGYTGLPDARLSKDLDKNVYKSDSRVGLTGLEKVYETELQGIPGKIEKRSFTSNNQNTQDRIVTDPTLGSDLKTTLNLDLQLRLYDLVQDEFNQAQVKSGSVIVMDAQTGAIKTMMNFPTFSPNSFENRSEQFKLKGYFSDALRPLFNRSLKGQYPPGSIIKPFVGAVAMQNDIIKPGQEILDAGYIQVKSSIVTGRVDRYINYKSTYLGIIDLSQAIAKSSDVFFYLLLGGDPETGKVPFRGDENSVNPLGIDKFKTDMTKYFGFGEFTGIDLDQENKGVVPEPSYKVGRGLGSWFLGDTYQSAIGQGFFLSTPIQIARATAVFANGGYLVTPHVKLEANSISKNSGLRPDVVKYISESMRQTVTDGTARRLLDNNSNIAAKTGSAQFDPNRPEQVYGWVISFNQNQDIIKDKLVVVVLTEDIDKTAEYITVPITNKIWQSIEYQYKIENESQNLEL
jgi:penicillin-binding protein 2